jgi:hypothetical protein
MRFFIFFVLFFSSYSVFATSHSQAWSACAASVKNTTNYCEQDSRGIPLIVCVELVGKGLCGQFPYDATIPNVCPNGVPDSSGKCPVSPDCSKQPGTVLNAAGDACIISPCPNSTDIRDPITNICLPYKCADPNKIRDPVTLACIPVVPPQDCPGDSYWDMNSQKCVPPTCPDFLTNGCDVHACSDSNYDYCYPKSKCLPKGSICTNDPDFTPPSQDPGTTAVDCKFPFHVDTFGNCVSNNSPDAPPSTTTTTTTAGDGTKTTVTTSADGTKTTVTTSADGTKTTSTTNPDGTTKLTTCDAGDSCNQSDLKDNTAKTVQKLTDLITGLNKGSPSTVATDTTFSPKYEKTNKTISGVFDSFSDDMSNTPLIGLTSSFFSVNTASSSCPVWSVNVWAFDLVIDQQCSPIMTNDVFPLVRSVIMLVFSFYAFRVAFL